MERKKKKILISIISLLCLIIGILLLRFVVFDNYKGKITVKNVASYATVLSANVSNLTSESNVSESYDTVKYTIKYTLSNDTNILRNAIIEARLTASESKYARFKEIKGNGITSTVSEDGIIVNMNNVSTNEEQTLELTLIISNAPFGFKVRPNVTVKEETSDERTINMDEITVNRNSIEGTVLDENGGKLSSIELSLIENGNEVRRTYTDSEGGYVFGNLNENSSYIIQVEEDAYKKIRIEDRSSSSEKRVLDIIVKPVEPFNLEINKYITKLNLNNNGKKEEYLYADETKVLRSIKNLKKLSGTIYYKIAIKNTGEIKGTIGSIQDIVPEGLTFDSSKNPGWEEKNGKLYYRVLEDNTLDAYEERSATLALDIKETNTAKTYINEAIGKSNEYKNVVFILDGIVYKEIYVLTGESIDNENIQDENFSGWYTDANYTNKYKFSNEVNKNMVLYGSLTSRKCTVRFYDEQSLLAEQEINCGEKATSFNPQEKEGYTFKYWTLDNLEYDFNQAVNSDINLYSYYEINRYDITYNLDGGSLEQGKTNPIVYTIESDTITLNNPIKEGYTFTGWTGTGLTDKTLIVTIPTGSTGNKEYTANYQINRSTLTINPNGGSYNGSTNPISIENDYGYVLTLDTPVRRGYTFIGWVLDGSGTLSNNSYTYGNENGRVTAEYEINNYAITYGGLEENEIISLNNPLTYNVLDSFTLNNPTREGYIFLGWTGSNGETPDTNVSVSAGTIDPLNYEAHFQKIEYTITYNLNNGTVNPANPTVYTVEDEITLNNPTKEGYTFTGWTGTDLSELTTNVKINKGSMGARTYTANYTPISYPITYTGLTNEEITTLNNPTSYTIEDAFTLINPQNRLDNDGDLVEIFAGWKKGSTTSTNMSIPTGTTGELSFEAIFNPADPDVYTISYDLVGGTLSEANPLSYTKKDNSFTLNNPTKEGYTFAGWIGTDLTEPTLVVTIAKGSRGNRSYTATYTPIDYTISYNGLTDSELSQLNNPTSYNIESNAIALNNPTREGYTFIGWTYNNETVLNVVIPTGSTGNREYTAVFSDNLYTITYNLNGGSVSTDNPTTYSIESNPITLNNPTKNGYNFTGWTGTGLTEKTLTVTIPTGSIGNREYVATYTPQEYTITYEGLTQEEITSLNNKVSYNIETPTFTLNNPTREGYRFTGWTGSNGDTPSNVTIQVGTTGNKTYTANFVKVDYTINYDLDGGTVAEANPTTYSIESSAITLNNPTKDGYNFTGWTGTGLSAITKDVIIPAGSTGNRNYVAHYEPQIYTITYEGLTSEELLQVNNPTSYTIESNAITLANPVRDGYTFIGWTGSNGNAPQLTVTINHGTTGNKTYTANFDINSYTVTYMNSNSIFHTDIVSYKEKTTAPSVDPVKSHAYFSHWSLEENGLPFNFETEIIDNTTLYAVFNPIEVPTITHTPIVWTNSNVIVNITSSHNDYEYYYKVDDGEYSKYTDDFEISQNSTIYAYSKYGNGTSEEASHDITNIDKILPQITSLYIPSVHTVDLNMQFQDNESGVSYYKIYLDNELVFTSPTYQTNLNELKNETYSISSLDASTDYSYKIELYDVAGNMQTYESTIRTSDAVYVARVIGMGGLIYDDPSQYELFESLQGAISYCGTTQCTVQIIPDELEESVTVIQGQDITFDLDGKRLYSDSLYTIENNGNLTIVDRNPSTESYGNILNSNVSGTVIKNNGTFILGENDGAVSVVEPLIVGANKGVENLGTFKFFDGKIKGIVSVEDVDETPYLYNSFISMEDGLETATLQKVDEAEARRKSKYYTNIFNAISEAETGDFTVDETKYLSQLTQVGEYGFTYNALEDSIISENTGINNSTSISMLRLDLTEYTENQMLYINYTMHSQSGKDYGYITILEEEALLSNLPAYNSTNGRILIADGNKDNVSKVKELEAGKVYYVYFGYYKDDSLSYYDDYFKINSFSLNGIGIQDMSTAFLSNSDNKFIALDDYYQIIDLSGNQAPLDFIPTMISGPKYNVANEAMDFDGRGVLKLDTNINITNEETLDITFSTTDRMGQSFDPYRIYTGRTSEKLEVYVRGDNIVFANSGSANTADLYALPSDFNNGQPHRLIVTYDNGVITPILDGTPLNVVEKYSRNDFGSNSQYSYLGTTYNGKVYSLKIYDKVVTSSDIDNNLYSSNLKLHYDFGASSCVTKVNERIYAPSQSRATTAYSYLMFDLTEETNDVVLAFDTEKRTYNSGDVLRVKMNNSDVNPGTGQSNAYYDLIISSSTLKESTSQYLTLKAGQINFVHFLFTKADVRDNGLLYLKNVRLASVSNTNVVYDEEKVDDPTFKFDRYYNATLKDIAGSRDYVDGSDGINRYDYTYKALNFYNSKYRFNSNETFNNEETVDIEFSTTNTGKKILYNGNNNEPIIIGVDGRIRIGHRRIAPTYDVPSDMYNGQKHRLTASVQNVPEVGLQYKLFYDGVELTQNGTSQFNTGDNNVVTIGGATNTNDYAYYGLIYNIKVYNKALEPSEIDSNPENENLKYYLNADDSRNTLVDKHSFINNNQLVSNSNAHSYIKYDLTSSTEDKYINISYSISSEVNDRGYITLTDSPVDPGPTNTVGRYVYASGTYSSNATVKLKKGMVNYLHIGYNKNGGTNTGTDTFIINGIYDSSSIIDNIYSISANNVLSDSQVINVPRLNEEEDTVELLKDITVSSPIVIPEEKALTIDLNGNTLTTTKNDYVINNKGSLTIKDSDYDNQFVEIDEAYIREQAMYDSIYAEEMAEYTDIIDETLEKLLNGEYDISTLKEGYYDYTGSVQSFTAVTEGEYEIETWGASGGYSLINGYSSTNSNKSGTPGKGGYSKGTIYLTPGDTLYIYVGSKGVDGTLEANAPASFNGGGLGTWDNNDDEAAGAGGGATDIRLTSGDWNNLQSLTSRIMVAGGGGGASWSYGAGYGGGLSGGNNSFNGNIVATQTTGYQFGIGKNGEGNGDGDGVAGGGGGYYGGSSSNSRNGENGSGGSGYISGHLGAVAVTGENNITPKNQCTDGTTDITCSYHYSGKIFTNTEMKSGNESMPTFDGTNTMVGNEGNGYAKIIYKGSSEPIINRDSAVVYASTILGINEPIRQIAELSYDSVTHRGVVTSSTYSTILNADRANLSIENAAISINKSGTNSAIINRGTLTFDRNSVIETKTDNNIGIRNETMGRIVTGNDKVQITVAGSSSYGISNSSAVGQEVSNFDITTASNAGGILDEGHADRTYSNIKVTGLGYGFILSSEHAININNASIDTSNNNIYISGLPILELAYRKPMTINNSTLICNGSSISNIRTTLGSNVDLTINTSDISNSVASNLDLFSGKITINGSSLNAKTIIAYNNGNLMFNNSTMTTNGSGIENGAVSSSEKYSHALLTLNSSTLTKTGGSYTTIITNNISNTFINNSTISSEVGSTGIYVDRNSSLSINGNSEIRGSVDKAINNLGVVTFGSANIKQYSTVYDYDYTGSVQTFTAPKSGNYRIETWGAAGGSGDVYASYRGGNGAYTSGDIYLNAGTTLYIYVGEKGLDSESNKSIRGSYNGGEHGTLQYISKGYGSFYTFGGSGGGATDISISNEENELVQTSTNFRYVRSKLSYLDRIMVAGAGGGGSSRSGAECVNGGKLSIIGTECNGINVLTGSQTTGSFGYTMSSDTFGGKGAGYYVDSSSSYGLGGTSYISGYTGSVAMTVNANGKIVPISVDGNTCTDGTTDARCSYHRSGYIFTNTVMKSGSEEMPTYDGSGVMIGNSGNGHAKITLLDEYTNKTVNTSKPNISSTSTAIGDDGSINNGKVYYYDGQLSGTTGNTIKNTVIVPKNYEVYNSVNDNSETYNLVSTNSENEDVYEVAIINSSNEIVKKYVTIQDAVDDVQEDTTNVTKIRVLRDIYTATNVVVPDTKNIEIDYNGHYVHSLADGYFITNNGILSVKNSGGETAYSIARGNGYILNNGTMNVDNIYLHMNYSVKENVVNNGTLTFNNVNYRIAYYDQGVNANLAIRNNETGIFNIIGGKYLLNKNESQPIVKMIDNYGELNITSTLIRNEKSNYSNIYDSYLIKNMENATAIIDDVTATDQNYSRMAFIQNYGTAEIRNSNIQKKGIVNVGTILIKDTTIDYVEGSEVIIRNSDNANMTLDGSTIKMDINDIDNSSLLIRTSNINHMITHNSTSTLTIESGTINVSGNAAITGSTDGTVILGVKGDNNVSIVDPLIQGTNYGIYLTSANSSIEFYDGIVKGAVSINGQISKTETGYAINMDRINNIESKYLVNTPAIKNVNTDVSYFDIKEAFDSANSGDTLQLLRNVTIPNTYASIVVAKTLTLDLNDFTIDVSNENFIVNNDNLTIINGTTESANQAYYSSLNSTYSSLVNKSLLYKTYDFEYVGDEEIFYAPYTGTYKISLWGAQGIDRYANDGSVGKGGRGAYTSGTITLNKGDALLIHVGGSGQNNVGAYNGGGYQNGGGATDVSIKNGNLNSRIMVAAGGGAGGVDGNRTADGGAGGKLNGLPGITSDGSGTPAQGGTQTVGGKGRNNNNDRAGAFGKGGRTTNNSTISGGGAGYYGGGGSASQSGAAVSGAGGSSYISGYTGSIAVVSDSSTTPRDDSNGSRCTEGTTDIVCSYHYSGLVFTNTVMKSGDEEIASPYGYSTIGNEGNGHARITLVSTSEEVNSNPSLKDAKAYISEVLNKYKIKETTGEIRTANVTPIVTNNGTLTIKSGMFSDTKSNEYTSLFVNDGTMNINGGVFTKQEGLVSRDSYVQGSIVDNNSSLTITDGVFNLYDHYKTLTSESAAQNTAINNKVGATANINGGEFISSMTAERVARGRLFYNSGVINIRGIVSNYSSVGYNTGTATLEDLNMEYLTPTTFYYGDYNPRDYCSDTCISYENVGITLNLGTLNIIGGRYATEAQFISNNGVLNINAENTDVTSLKRLSIGNKNNAVTFKNRIIRLLGPSTNTINNLVFYAVDGSDMIYSNSTNGFTLSNSIMSNHIGLTDINILAGSEVGISNSRIVSNTGNAINNSSTANIYVDNTEIVSNTKVAFNNTGAAKLSIGTKADGNVSITSPSFRGGTYGIYSNNNSFRVSFYDGIIKGKTNAISATFEEYESGYSAIDGTEVIDGVNYKTKYLDRVEIAQNARTLTKYYELGEAFDAAENGDTIRLISNYTTLATTETIEIEDTKTLDLNGYEINQTIDYLFENNGNFTLVDNSPNKDGFIYILSGISTFDNNGTLTLDGIEIQAKSNIKHIINRETGTVNIINGTYLHTPVPSETILNYGTMNITDSTIYNDHSVEINDLNLIINETTGVINAKDSTIYSKGAIRYEHYSLYDAEVFENDGIIHLDNVTTATIDDPTSLIHNRQNGKLYITNNDPSIPYSIGLNMGYIELIDVEMTLTKYDRWYATTFVNQTVENLDGGIIRIEDSKLYATDDLWLSTGVLGNGTSGGTIYITNTEMISPNKSFGVISKYDGSVVFDTVTFKGDSSNETGTYLISRGGNITLRNTSLRTTASSAIAVYEGSGAINIEDSDITTLSSNSAAISVESSATVNLIKGSITSRYNGINLIHANANINIGDNDSSYNSSIFNIVAENRGINITNGKLNFFDGTIKGKSKAIYGVVTSVEDGYRVVTRSEDSYDVAYLNLVDTAAVVAESNGIQFDDLQAAINYGVRKSKPVNLVANMILSDNLTASGPVDLYLNGFSFVTTGYTVSSNIDVHNGSNPSGSLSSLFGINNNTMIIIYEMEDGSMLKSNVNYRLYKDNKLQRVDEEEAGTYSVGGTDEILKPIKGRIYVSEIGEGNYRLVGSDNKEVSFSIDEDGNVTGNIKVYTYKNGRESTINSAKAELILTIQTGIRRINYMFIALSLIIILFVMFLIKRKREETN